MDNTGAFIGTEFWIQKIFVVVFERLRKKKNPSLPKLEAEFWSKSTTHIAYELK